MHTETPRHTKTQLHTATTLKVYRKIVNKNGLCLNWSAFDHELGLSRQVLSEQLRLSMLTDCAKRNSRQISRLPYTFHSLFIPPHLWERSFAESRASTAPKPPGLTLNWEKTGYKQRRFCNFLAQFAASRALVEIRGNSRVGRFSESELVQNPSR